jgi:hypothetical protein
VNREGLEKALGLDVPLSLQYVRWLGVVPQEDGQFRGLLQANLGKSLWKNQDIGTLLMQRLPVSLELTAIALISALITAIPIGVYSAIRQDTVGDYIGPAGPAATSGPSTSGSIRTSRNPWATKDLNDSRSGCDASGSGERRLLR